LHPIQLYEAAGLLILFLILMMWRKRKAFEGELALTGFMAYSLIRFFLEFVRGDADRGFVLHGWLSISQLVSLVLFVVCAGVLLLQHRWAAGLRGERLEQRQSPDVLKRAA
jgi:phosphatidylglycerol:prolipoprotein diacylglycerol transferase